MPISYFGIKDDWLFAKENGSRNQQKAEKARTVFMVVVLNIKRVMAKTEFAFLGFSIMSLRVEINSMVVGMSY